MQILSIGKKKRIHALAFSPGGDELATISGDHIIRIWNLASGKVRLEASLEGTSSGYDFTYLDHRRIIYSDGRILLWDIASNRWQLIAPGYAWGQRIKISPNGEYLIAVNQSPSTDVPAGEGLQVRTTADWQLQPPMPDAENTSGGVAFSRDGSFLATSHITNAGQRRRSYGGYAFHVNAYDYVVHLREMPTGRILKTLDGWQQSVTHLAFSPDGAVLAGTAGPRLRIWDLQSNCEIAVHKRGTKHFQGLSFAHDGSFLATVSNDATVRIWNARTWEEHTTFTWDIGAMLNIAFAPDGLRAAASSDRGQIVIWDVE